MAVVFDPAVARRTAALPWKGEAVAATYVRMHPRLSYRDDFVALCVESYNAYQAGCPRSSMIVAGEALLRIVFESLVDTVRKGASISRKNREELSSTTRVGRLFALGEIHDGFNDHLNFCEALKIAEASGIFNNELVECMFHIKFLRDRSAHGQLPLLHPWDPDEPRPLEVLTKLRGTRDWEPPEGYRFFRPDLRSSVRAKAKRRSGRNAEIRPDEPASVPLVEARIDTRKHWGLSLKQLDYDEQFAAIQQLLFWKVLADLTPPAEREASGES